MSASLRWPATWPIADPGSTARSFYAPSVPLTVPSLLTDLVCPGCQRVFDASKLQGYCTTCSRTLLSRYDLEMAKNLLSVDSWLERPPDLWRFEELLPIQDPAFRTSLGEVETPILRLWDEAFGLDTELLLKQDGSLPTGTFKARGMAVAVSRARELGAKELFVPSAGNAGAAMAAYARRAGLRATVYLPKDAPASAQEQVLRYGGFLRTVEGHIGDAGRVAREEAGARGAFDLSTLREPYRAEGKKTMGLEIFLRCGRGRMPDAIVYPTGGGTGILGMRRAFQQLKQMGWMGESPRLYAAQAEGCAPVIDALEHHLPKVRPVASPTTGAAGLRVPAPFSSEDILEALRGTHGGGAAVPEADIELAARRLAGKHGISVAREVGAALAAVAILRERRALDRGDRVLVYGTGGWAG